MPFLFLTKSLSLRTLTLTILFHFNTCSRKPQKKQAPLFRNTLTPHSQIISTPRPVLRNHHNAKNQSYEHSNYGIVHIGSFKPLVNNFIRHNRFLFKSGVCYFYIFITQLKADIVITTVFRRYKRRTRTCKRV